MSGLGEYVQITEEFLFGEHCAVGIWKCDEEIYDRYHGYLRSPHKPDEPVDDERLAFYEGMMGIHKEFIKKLICSVDFLKEILNWMIDDEPTTFSEFGKYTTYGMYPYEQDFIFVIQIKRIDFINVFESLINKVTNI